MLLLLCCKSILTSTCSKASATVQFSPFLTFVIRELAQSSRHQNTTNSEYLHGLFWKQMPIFSKPWLLIPWLTVIQLLLCLRFLNVLACFIPRGQPAPQDLSNFFSWNRTYESPVWVPKVASQHLLHVSNFVNSTFALFNSLIFWNMFYGCGTGDNLEWIVAKFPNPATFSCFL